MTVRTPQRFQILSKLGEGGMGIVYDAYDRNRDMRLAVKALRYVDAWGLYRFKREFRALSNLSHPNIITLYELYSEDDEWFLLMELIDGVDFTTHVSGSSRQRSNTPSAVSITPAIISAITSPGGASVGGWGAVTRLEDALWQLACALEALHSVGVIHRDLKPENVLVTREGRVVLMDFGVISELGRPLDQTSGDGVVGTPLYMAPEQVVGPASVAADWYAFGVMLYLALTGQAPFLGSSLQVMDNKLFCDPLPPEELVCDVPGHLSELCMQLMAREIEDRAGFDEVARALGKTDAVRSRTRSMVADSDVFVGREPELEILRRACDQAIAAQGQCVFVQGPSGMGKTALLDRFVEELEDAHPTMLLLSARCHENESLAYKAFDGAIDELSDYLMRRVDDNRPVALPRDARAIAQLFPTLSQIPGFAPTSMFQDRGGQASRSKAIAALQEIFATLAQELTLVLRIEDLHWADRESLELLRAILHPPAPARLLVLATIRTATVDASTTPALEEVIEELSEAGTCGRIRIEPLGWSEQQELRRRWSMRGLQLDHLDANLWREAGGHPMLLAELAHYAQEHPEELPERGDLDALDLKEVVWKRVIGLSEKVRSLIELVAVAGEPTPLKVLGKAGQLTDTERERGASVLRIARLARQVPKPRREVWVDSYHDKVRESVTQHIGAERNTALHRQLAEALRDEEIAPPARLGRHFAAAGMMPEAARYTVEAAREAARKLAYRRAEELYRQALGWMDDMDIVGLELELCRARVGLAECRRLHDDYDGASAQLHSAREIAEEHGFRDELAMIHFLLGGVCFIRVDIEGCLREHGAARSLAHEVQSPRLEAQALAGLADAEYLRGRMLSSFRYYDECVQLAQEHGFIDIEVPNLGMRGFTWHCQNDLPRALRDCTASLEKALEFDLGRAEAIVRGSWMSSILLEMAEFHRAEEMLERALVVVRALGLDRFEAYHVALKARAWALQGRRADAERLVNGAVVMSREADGLTSTGPACLGAQALLTSDPALRRSALDEASAILAAGSFSHNYLWFHRSAIDVTLRTGAFDETLHHAQALEDYVAAEPFPWAQFIIDRGRALANHGRGHRDPETMKALERLRDEARAGGMVLLSRDIDAALDDGNHQ